MLTPSSERNLFFEALGQRVSLRLANERLQAAAQDLHSSIQVQTGLVTNEPDIAWHDAGPDRCRIWLSGQLWADNLSLDDAFIQTENLVTQLFLSRLPHYLHLHAAAVVHPSGGAWLICGPSGAGKTSLTLAFLLEGWGWLSDECVFAASENSLVVRGLPRNFNLKEPAFAHFPEIPSGAHCREVSSRQRRMKIRFIDPTRLFPQKPTPEAPLKGILFPAFSSQCTTARIERMTALAAAEKLLPELSLTQPWAPAWLARAAAGLPALEVTYAHPRQAVAKLLGMLVP